MSAEPDAWRVFAELCERLAAHRGKLAKRGAIAEYLRTLDATTAGLAAQYLTGAPFAESEDRTLQVGGQVLARALETVTKANAAAMGAAYRRYGDLGAAAEELLHSVNLPGKALSLEDIARRFALLAVTRLRSARQAELTDLLRCLSPLEAKYAIKLMLGDMRTGVKQSLVEEAIAQAVGESLEAVRRAVTLLGNLQSVVELAWQHKLDTARFQMFHPLGFMLATPAESAEQAYARFGAKSTPAIASGEAPAIPSMDHPVQVEDKYDGMRAQIHCGDPKQCGDPEQPGRVRIFSRTRDDVTASFPELAEWFSSVHAAAILDGEILAWDFSTGRARPFTALQQRLGRKRVTHAMRQETPVLFMAFDILLAGSELLLDAPLQQRRASLESWSEAAMQSVGAVSDGAVPNSKFGEPAQANLFDTDTVTNPKDVTPRLQLAPVERMSSPAHIDAAFDAARARGNEGLMLKSLESTYQPGRRGLAWIKLKRELATLDVVVTAVEYGHGRRARVLSDYTFAVRGGGELKNVGKAYSGLTDEEISTLTQWFLDHTLDAAGHLLLVEPKIVLEVAFNNVMQSDRHSSGYSLRFPRIVRLRTDKPVEEIDTIARVAEIFRTQHVSVQAADIPVADEET